ncbi:hypothetical protein ACFL6D_04565 [Spirochaetota bacterium]
MKKACIFCISLLLISCASKKPIRTIKKAREAYVKKNLKEIERLIEATTVENRDIKSVSVYYLAKYIDIIQKKKLNTKFTERDKEKHLLTVKDHLVKVFSIQQDFNTRSICLYGLRKLRTDDLFELYIELLDDADDTINEIALISLIDYTADKTYRTDTTLNLLLNHLKNHRPPIVFYILDNIRFFKGNKKAIEGINNYLKISSDKEAILYAKQVLKEVESVSD